MINPDLLNRYADILIRFALNSGQGIKPGEVIFCSVPDIAKPMYGALQRSILRSKGIPMMRLTATGFARDYFTQANDSQLTFFPKNYLKERVKLVDHYVSILADHDLTELKGIDPQKMIKAAEATKKVRDWQNDKEYAGKMTWTLGLFGTPAMAKAAGLTLKDYWDQIISACYLDYDDPIKKWKDIAREQNRLIKQLDSLQIDRIHLVADSTDLWLTLGQARRFVGGSGRNIPSFEIFTSPDWRGTEGVIAFNQPLYRFGQLIRDITLEFRRGKVVKATAKKGQALLDQIINRPNADKIGEFSLTDARFSRITKFMANTLYDENIGGQYGNTHLAVGMSYRDAFAQDPKTLTKKMMRQLGFNDSGEHTDIVSTTDRQVTAILKDGSSRVIYADGKFTL